jgi:pimeloyl-ACP methyl ester carboxylesterase
MTGSPEIRTRQIHWSWEGRELSLGVDEAGGGPSVLLLPALSSISTRREMHPLMKLLAARAHVIAPDWPGFGDQPRPPIAWTPEALSSFLDRFVHEETSALHGTVAAGHAASYALHLAAREPGLLGRLALIAPTWRGPLPTMAGGDRPFFGAVRQAIGLPVIGPLLYRLNVNPFIVRMMVAGHVYSDARNLSAEQTRDKQSVIDASGARFASAAFVAGGLDRVGSRTAFIELARQAGDQILLAYGAETPPKSREEMEALAALPGVRSFAIERGKLGIHEECAETIAPAIAEFLFDGQ